MNVRLLRLAGLVLAQAALPLWATTFTVTNTSDSGPGSLRQAIIDANADTSNCSTTTPHSIGFNIPGAGPHVIAPTSALPTIVSFADINGYTQPGTSQNTLATGTNAVLSIVIDGSAAGATDALVYGIQTGRPCTPSFSSVLGLVIRNFSGAAISAATNVFGAKVPALPPGKFLTALAIRVGSAPDSPFISSEFSACLLITGPPLTFTDIPTLSEWSLMSMAPLLGMLGLYRLRKH